MTNEITLSIDRQARKFAIFDGLAILQDFRPYLSEEQAIHIAREFIEQHYPQADMKIIHPFIKRMNMHS